MGTKHARGTWIARCCIALGLGVILFSVARFATGSGGVLALVVGLPVLLYGLYMHRALRRTGE